MSKTINLSENKNPLAPSKITLDCIKTLKENIYKYPDYKNLDINKSVSEFFDVPEKNITITNGSMEAISILIRILTSKSSFATIYSPTFWGYENIFKKQNVNLNIVDLDSYLCYNLNHIERDAKKSTIMFLCNPNNPTLSEIDKVDLEKIIKTNSKCQFIIDETMLLFDESYEKKTMSHLVTNYNNISVICSLSKFFGIAGIRAGVVISNESMINDVKEMLVPYSIDIVKQTLIPQILKDKLFIIKSREYIKEARGRFVNELNKIKGCKTISSSASFILLNFSSITAEEMITRLRDNDIIVRNISEAYPALPGQWIRISTGKHSENKKVVKIIKQSIHDSHDAL